MQKMILVGVLFCPPFNEALLNDCFSGVLKDCHGYV